MNDTAFYLLIGLLGIVFIVVLLVAVAKFIHEFSKELRYINMEIGRTNGAEKKYWMSRRRRLWLSFLPFVK